MTVQIGGRTEGARGAAHVKHEAHVRDAGGVPAQRLVEGFGELPRVASRGEGATAGWWAGRGAVGGQRTINMLFMSVTREVSQAEMSALKLCTS